MFLKNAVLTTGSHKFRRVLGVIVAATQMAPFVQFYFFPYAIELLLKQLNLFVPLALLVARTQ